MLQLFVLVFVFELPFPLLDGGLSTWPPLHAVTVGGTCAQHIAVRRRLLRYAF